MCECIICRILRTELYLSSAVNVQPTLGKAPFLSIERPSQIFNSLEILGVYEMDR